MKFEMIKKKKVFIITLAIITIVTLGGFFIINMGNTQSLKDEGTNVEGYNLKDLVSISNTLVGGFNETTKDGNSYISTDKENNVLTEIKNETYNYDIEISKWDKEVYFKILMPEPTLSSSASLDDKIETNYADFTTNVYMKEDNEFEFEIVLDEKPVGNKFIFDLEYENLRFSKQPDLSSNPNYDQPENVINSYAVYHVDKKNNKYKTGKVFHIYRIKAIDDKGGWTWGDMDIDEEKKTITIIIPQDFLDKAVYPLVIDPLFGYDVVGGTGVVSDDEVQYYKITMPETGILQSIWSAGQSYLAPDVKYAIYSSNGTHADSKLEESVGSYVLANWGSPYFRKLDMAETLELTGSVVYYLAVGLDGAGRIQVDYLGVGGLHWYEIATSFPATASPKFEADNDVSIYLRYTPNSDSDDIFDYWDACEHTEASCTDVDDFGCCNDTIHGDVGTLREELVADVSAWGEDTTFDEAPIFKFNISSVLGNDLVSAKVCFDVISLDTNLNPSCGMTTYRLDNQTWDETIIGEPPVGHPFDWAVNETDLDLVGGNCDEGVLNVIGEYCYNVTDQLAYDYDLNNDYFSSMIFFNVSTISTIDDIVNDVEAKISFENVDEDYIEVEMESREVYDFQIYLNITYSPSGGSPPADCWFVGSNYIYIPTGCEYYVALAEEVYVDG